MNTTTKFIAILALAAVTLSGCLQMDGPQDDAEYSSAVPASSAISIDVPGGGNGALAIGETAEFYTITKGVSDGVNIHVGVLLAYIKFVSLLPPTERGEDYRVWGPSEPQGLENVSWRLRIDKVSETRFAVTLDGRKKGDTGEFIPVIMGEVTPGADDLSSTGTLNLLYDNSNALESDPCRTGTISVDWDGTTEVRTVDVTWDNFVNSCADEEFLDVTYHYSQAADYSGNFEFRVINNIHEETDRPEKETVTMRSRWMGDGTGRSDVVLEGAEIAADLTSLNIEATEVKASQCWDNLFLLTYSDTEPTELEDFIFEELGETSACPFEEAEYPAL